MDELIVHKDVHICFTKMSRCMQWRYTLTVSFVNVHFARNQFFYSFQIACKWKIFINFIMWSGNRLVWYLMVIAIQMFAIGSFARICFYCSVFNGWLTIADGFEELTATSTVKILKNLITVNIDVEIKSH